MRRIALLVHALPVFDRDSDAGEIHGLLRENQIDLERLREVQQRAARRIVGRNRVDAVRRNAQTEIREPRLDVCDLVGADPVVEVRADGFDERNCPPRRSSPRHPGNGMAPNASERMPARQPSSPTAVPRGRRLSGGRVCFAVRAPPVPSILTGACGVWAGERRRNEQTRRRTADRQHVFHEADYHRGSARGVQRFHQAVAHLPAGGCRIPPREI